MHVRFKSTNSFPLERAIDLAGKMVCEWGMSEFGGKKKGADSGIDGLIYFKPEGKTTEKAIVSVKGGENVNVAMVRDLAHVVDREKAKIGVFITLAESTGPMRRPMSAPMSPTISSKATSAAT